MTTVDLGSYKKLYLQTAKENSESLSSNYIKISRNSLDKDALKNMYISAHSLKSKSQVMGYIKIATLSGMIEKTIKNIIDSKIRISDSSIEVIKDAIENIKLLLRNIEERDPSTPPRQTRIRSG